MPQKFNSKSLRTVIKVTTLFFVYKILNNLVPTYLSAKLQLQFSSYKTRQRNDVLNETIIQNLKN